MIRLTDYKFRVYDASLGMLAVKTVNFKTNIMQGGKDEIIYPSARGD